MPPRTPQLIGHGLKFCVKPAYTNDMICHTFDCLETDQRLQSLHLPHVRLCY
jgi:hypothetical protein